MTLIKKGTALNRIIIECTRCKIQLKVKRKSIDEEVLLCSCPDCDNEIRVHLDKIDTEELSLDSLLALIPDFTTIEVFTGIWRISYSPERQWEQQHNERIREFLIRVINDNKN